MAKNWDEWAFIGLVKLSVSEVAILLIVLVC